MQFSDILVKNALFCDETEDYRTPAEQKVCLTFMRHR